MAAECRCLGGSWMVPRKLLRCMSGEPHDRTRSGIPHLRSRAWSVARRLVLAQSRRPPPGSRPHGVHAHAHRTWRALAPHESFDKPGHAHHRHRESLSVGTTRQRHSLRPLVCRLGRVRRTRNDSRTRSTRSCSWTRTCPTTASEASIGRTIGNASCARTSAARSQQSRHHGILQGGTGETPHLGQEPPDTTTHRRVPTTDSTSPAPATASRPRSTSERRGSRASRLTRRTAEPNGRVGARAPFPAVTTS
jgi:hypothetical protein